MVRRTRTGYDIVRHARTACGMAWCVRTGYGADCDNPETRGLAGLKGV